MTAVPDDALSQTQARQNRSTETHWEHFAPHRRRVLDLLLPGHAAKGDLLELDRRSKSLCVLGAGNCNDLELPPLLDAFDQLTLVDIDPVALVGAVTRQGVGGHPGLRTLAPVDLTDVGSTMATWPKHRPTPQAVDACIRKLETSPLPSIGQPFDVILSPCLLSQLCLLSADTLGRAHPKTRSLRLALRHRHLRQVVEWLRPGGTGIFVIDLIQAAHLGSLLTSHGDRLQEVAGRAVGRRKHFPALDPASLRRTLLSEPQFKGMATDVNVTEPWMWALGPHKSFLVYAMTFRRTATPIL